MFETVAPEIAGRRSRLILYESLPVSIAVHGAAIAVAVIVATCTVTFPTQSPRYVRPYQLVTIPDPPPPPSAPFPPTILLKCSNMTMEQFANALEAQAVPSRRQHRQAIELRLNVRVR